VQSLRLKRHPDGGIAAENLPLRMPQASGVIDPEPFRQRARGNGSALSEAFAPSRGMRCLHLPTGYQAPLFDVAGPVLTFVISGMVTIFTSNLGAITLEPGDIFLLNDVRASKGIAPIRDCRLVQVLLEPDWPGSRARPANFVSSHPRGNHGCNFKRMVTGEDDRSTFYKFSTLFGKPGEWSAVTPLIGLRFIGMAEGTFIDWHPEIVNNLVIVMSGSLELEVGGDGGAVELFRQGDICLAQDRTGEGHIDRVHGFVQVAVLIVDDADLWPLRV
jgi:hypothetical protein